MANTAANAEVARTGVVSVGETTATAPTDVDSALTGFTDLGYLSEDGVSQSEDISVDFLRGWQGGGEVIRSIRSNGTVTFSFTLLETSTAALEFALGVTIASGSFTYDVDAARDHKSLVIDVVDGDDLTRMYLADVEVTEVGDIVRVNNEITGYPVTITAYKHATYGNYKQWSTRLGATTS